MSTKSHEKRLRALDGLRGVAVLLVFFEHTNNAGLTRGFGQYLPSQIYNSIFINGATGVSLFFILSGFLMAFLYQRPSSWHAFLQKRYTRIFPLFIAVTLGIYIGYLVTNIWWLKLLIVLSTATLIHFLWVYKGKKLPDKSKTWIFFSFFILQILIGIIGLLILNNFTKLSGSLLSTYSWISNTTLTYFISDPNQAFDSVYWSLAAEVLFYIIYPIICVPVILYLSPKSRLIKILFIISLIPLFFGASRMLGRSPNINAIRPVYFFYFVGGMSMGYLYNKYYSKLANLKPSHIKVASIIGILTIVGYFAFMQIPPQWINFYIRQLVVTLPFVIILGVLLIPDTVIGRVFSSRAIVFIGTISYSLYLTHNWIIFLIVRTMGKSQSILLDILAIATILCVCILIASAMYWLLEKPYFQKQKAKSISVAQVKNFNTTNGLAVCIGICIIYLGLTTISYRTNLTYEDLSNPKMLKMIASSIHTKTDSALLVDERVKVTDERNKTIEMILPFALILLYLIWDRVYKARSNRMVKTFAVDETMVRTKINSKEKAQQISLLRFGQKK